MLAVTLIRASGMLLGLHVHRLTRNVVTYWPFVGFLLAIGSLEFRLRLYHLMLLFNVYYIWKRK